MTKIPITFKLFNFFITNKHKKHYSQYAHAQILVVDHSSHAPLNRITQLHINKDKQASKLDFVPVAFKSQYFPRQRKVIL